MSDDYTPTTAEVRGVFARFLAEPDVRAEQFDRWLAEVERAAEERGYKRGYADAELQAQYQEPVSEGLV